MVHGKGLAHAKTASVETGDDDLLGCGAEAPKGVAGWYPASRGGARVFNGRKNLLVAQSVQNRIGRAGQSQVLVVVFDAHQRAVRVQIRPGHRTVNWQRALHQKLANFDALAGLHLGFGILAGGKRQQLRLRRRKQLPGNGWLRPGNGISAGMGHGRTCFLVKIGGINIYHP